jgi:hypothetical protein
MEHSPKLFENSHLLGKFHTRTYSMRGPFFLDAFIEAICVCKLVLENAGHVACLYFIRALPFIPT